MWLLISNCIIPQESVDVHFNEAMQSTGMSNPDNFQWDNGLITLTAQLVGTVTCRLTVSEPVMNVWYRVEVFNVFDLAGNIVNPEKDTASYIWSPVPVELTAFTVKVITFSEGYGVLLEWATATEVNNYGFDIERDKKKIAFVEGHGNSNSPKYYLYTDILISGRHTYRLKQIDTDGTFSYSVELSINVGEVETLKVYPNPTTNQFVIKLSVISPYHKVAIYTSLGELIEEYNPQDKIYITSDYASGVYIIRYMNRNTKLMVIK